MESGDVSRVRNKDGRKQ